MRYPPKDVSREGANLWIRGTGCGSPVPLYRICLLKEITSKQPRSMRAITAIMSSFPQELEFNFG